jgi:hypothetical protein
VRDAALAEQGRAFFERTLEHCKQIEAAAWKASRSFWDRLKEEWAYFVLSKVDPYLTQLQLEVLAREMLYRDPPRHEIGQGVVRE